MLNRNSSRYKENTLGLGLIDFEEGKAYHGVMEIQAIDRPVGSLNCGAKVRHLYKRNPKASISDIIYDHNLSERWGKTPQEAANKLKQDIKDWVAKQ